MVCDQGRDEETQFFGVGVSNRRRKFKLFGLQVEPPTPIPSFNGTSDLYVKKRLFTVMILKKVSGSNFFQFNKFTVCKIKDGK